MPSIALEHALPEPRSCRRQFDRAAATFDQARFIHDESRRRLLERLEALRVEPGTYADIGAAHAHGARALADRYPAADVVAVDASSAMLGSATSGSFARIAGDAEKLPFAAGSISLLFANQLLPWTMPERLFAEARRVLSPGGILLFATLGPESLAELRHAWSRVDDKIHVHALWDVQTLGDLVVRAGLEEPVLDVDRIEVSYADVGALVADLRACGATNTAAGRRHSLTGKARWQGFVDALAANRPGQRFKLTIELILGVAFGSRQTSRAGSGGEIVVPIDSLKRR